MLGFLPYIDNYSNIGGLLSGFLLGFVLLFTPQLRQVAQNKLVLFDNDVKSSFNWKPKLDRPVLASVSLLLFALLWVFLFCYFLQQVIFRCFLSTWSCVRLRGASFVFSLAGFLVAVLQGINIGQYCRWCGYVDCIPSKRWSCNDVTTSCEV